jgi:glycosyltransferase involved in cell wall biosynthesis
MAYLLRLAVFSPLPPARTGIASYSWELLHHMADLAEVDAYTDPLPTGYAGAAAGFKVFPIEDFVDRPGRRYHYDACIYHMGNHPGYHERIYSTLLRFPGIVVLHEVDLRAFHWNRAAPYQSHGPYCREMGYAYGLAGVQEARLTRAGRREIATGTFPLFERIADSSLGLIVHTENARERVRARSPQARVVYIPLGVQMAQMAPMRAQGGLDTGYPAGTVLLASFGHIAPSKRLETVLQALSQLRNEFSNIRYLLVGEAIPGYDVAQAAARLGVSDLVRVTGYVDDEAYRAYLEAVDIGINLRSAPTTGEMSATLLHLLAHGRPTLVSDVDGFQALPEECVIKVRQDEDEVADLVSKLRRLLANPSARAAYAEAGRRYVQERHSFTTVARQHIEFVRECLDAIATRLEAYA